MEIKDDLIQEKIQEALPKIVEDIFGSSYNSPLKKVVQEAIDGKEGAIKVLVNDIINKALNDETFKKQLGEAVIAKIVEKGLK